MNPCATSMKTLRRLPVAAALVAGLALLLAACSGGPSSGPRPVTECRLRRVIERRLRIGGCLLGLHAGSRCRELSRPQQPPARPHWCSR